jgi:hypothetical protein
MGLPIYSRTPSYFLSPPRSEASSRHSHLPMSHKPGGEVVGRSPRVDRRPGQRTPSQHCVVVGSNDQDRHRQVARSRRQHRIPIGSPCPGRRSNSADRLCASHGSASASASPPRPFDRVIVAQSQVEQMPLVTVDKDIRLYTATFFGRFPIQEAPHPRPSILPPASLLQVAKSNDAGCVYIIESSSPTGYLNHDKVVCQSAERFIKLRARS